LEGDLVFTVRGTIGKVGLITESHDGAQLSPNLIRFSPNREKVDSVFLWYFLQSIKETAAADIQNEVTIASVRASDLSELKIPLPPLPEQKRIASLLARADRLRQLRRVARDLSDTLLQSVFLEMFGEYLNKIECQFGDVLEIALTNGFFEKNDKYGEGTPIVWVDNLYHTNKIDTTNLRRVQVSQKDSDRYAVIEGDLLFTRSSLVAEGVGRANIVPKLEEQTMFESHVIRARVDKKKINPFFALGLFRSQFGISEMMKRAKTATMTTIGQDTLYEFPCMLPPLNLQEQFAGVVARVEGLRARMSEAERQAERLFESLLNQVFHE
jgi:type I restriction enzyme S subunit